MNRSNFHFMMFVILLITLSSVRIAVGCMCLETPTVSDAYFSADAVVAGEVESVETILTPNDHGSYRGRQKISIRIITGFKGINESSIWLSQPMTSCDWQFKETDNGKQLLLYLRSTRQPNEYSIEICGRSDELKNAIEDLKWLKKSRNPVKLPRVKRRNIAIK